MRPTGVPTVAEKSRQEGLDERDDRMERAYNFDRRGERSTLAFVTTYRDELVEEFFAWRRQQALDGIWTGEGVFDGLLRFERARFGADLYVGARGVLWFGVRVKLAPGEGGRHLPPGYFDRAPVKVKALPARAADALAAKAARGHRMPLPRMSRAQRDERLLDLERQAVELRAEAEADEAARLRVPGA